MIQSNRGFLVTICLVVVALNGCAKTTVNGMTQSELAYHPQVQHVVICWLREPGNVEGRKKLIEVSYGFRHTARGLIDVTAGAPLSSARPGVDQSFDVAIVMSFKDASALEEYESSPEHQQAVAEVLRPLTSRVVIYDSFDGAWSVNKTAENEQGRPTTTGRP